MDWLTIGVSFLFGFAGAVAGWFVMNGYFWAEIQSVKRQAASAWGREHTAAGVQGRQETDAEIQAALAESAGIIKGEGSAQDKAAALLQLGVKYPRAAARLIREIKKAGIADQVGLGGWAK